MKMWTNSPEDLSRLLQHTAPSSYSAISFDPVFNIGDLITSYPHREYKS
jgi:hypothetical protein